MAEEFDSYQHEQPTYAERQEARRGSQVRTRRIVLGVAGVVVGALVIDLALEWGFGLRLLFRSSDEWEMITFRNDAPGEVYSAVYYTGHVSEDEARRLGAYFVRAGLFQVPHSVSALLSRADGEYVVSFFIAEGQFDNPDLIQQMRENRRLISAEVFGGQPVAIQLCEQRVWPAGSYPIVRIRRVIRDQG